MTKKQQQTSSDNVLNAFFQNIDSNALAAIQQRNMNAITEASKLISEATMTVVQQQMELMASLSASQPQSAKPNGKLEDIGDAFHTQFKSNRDALEQAVTCARAINDTMRSCCMNVAGEFETCTEDNLRSLNTQMRDAAPTPSEDITPASPRAISA